MMQLFWHDEVKSLKDHKIPSVFDVSLYVECLGLDYLGNSDTKKSFAFDTILFP